MYLSHIENDNEGLLINVDNLSGVHYEQQHTGGYTVSFYLVGHKEPINLVNQSLSKVNKILKGISNATAQ